MTLAEIFTYTPGVFQPAPIPRNAKWPLFIRIKGATAYTFWDQWDSWIPEVFGADYEWADAIKIR